MEYGGKWLAWSNGQGMQPQVGLCSVRYQRDCFLLNKSSLNTVLNADGERI